MLMALLADRDIQSCEILNQAVRQKTGQKDMLDLMEEYLAFKTGHQAPSRWKC